MKYVQISKSEIPEGVRFDVPRQNQGQTVEVAYGDFGQAECGVGSRYKRVRDLSGGLYITGYAEYFRLVKTA